MNKETFINQMTARGYELETVANGNITATKGGNTVRFVPLANYVIYIDTPTVTAIVREGVSDAETMRIVAGLTD